MKLELGAQRAPFQLLVLVYRAPDLMSSFGVARSALIFPDIDTLACVGNQSTHLSAQACDHTFASIFVIQSFECYLTRVIFTEYSLACVGNQSTQ